MALGAEHDSRHPAEEIVMDPYDRIADDLYDQGTGRSNFVAFLVGGVVIAGGMTAFLYYDASTLDPRDSLATGSISRMEAPSVAPSIRIPIQPTKGAKGP